MTTAVELSVVKDRHVGGPFFFLTKTRTRYESGAERARSDFQKFLQRPCSWQLADAITSEGFPHYREEKRGEEGEKKAELPQY